jgi:hypothetical protein
MSHDWNMPKSCPSSEKQAVRQAGAGLWEGRTGRDVSARRTSGKGVPMFEALREREGASKSVWGCTYERRPMTECVHMRTRERERVCVCVCQRRVSKQVGEWVHEKERNKTSVCKVCTQTPEKDHQEERIKAALWKVLSEKQLKLAAPSQPSQIPARQWELGLWMTKISISGN